MARSARSGEGGRAPRGDDDAALHKGVGTGASGQDAGDGAARDVPEGAVGTGVRPARGLGVQAVSASYGAVPALHAVSFALAAGEVVALLGANGSGRSTLLRVLTGLLAPTAGSVLLDGRSLDGVPAHARVRRGLALVPEGRRVFARLSVHDNLRTGASTVADPQGAVQDVYARLPVLAQRRDQPAGTLSGGEQQLLALGRALASRPSVLLLDEPTTGLAPQAAERVLDQVVALAAQGMAVLLVEQDAGVALSVAQRGLVLETGRLVLSGPAAQLAADPALTAAYLGEPL